MILDKLPLLTQKHVVLASASPRRQQLLTQLGLPHKVIVSNFSEDLPKQGLTAATYAERTAKEKALDVARSLAPKLADLIIGADTVVECEGHILEKPENDDDARRMLNMLSGKEHLVHTGVALVVPRHGTGESGLQAVTFSETTKVVFGNLSLEQIDAYIATKEPFGKAGAYGIQGPAAAFVKRVEGCYFNVVGLPLYSLTMQIRTVMGGNE
jgi:septum formation protein